MRRAKKVSSLIASASLAMMLNVFVPESGGAATVVKSKSNMANNLAAPPGAVVKSKSNMANNRAASPAAIQPIKDDGRSKGFSGLEVGPVLENFSTVTVDAGGGVSGSDPNCSTPGAKCAWAKVVLPPGSQYVGAQVYATNTGSSDWVPCPVHPGGFMDCARYIGWVRFLKAYPEVQTTASGVEVSWQIINWATYKRDGKLVVQYTRP